MIEKWGEAEKLDEVKRENQNLKRGKMKHQTWLAREKYWDGTFFSAYV